MLSVNTHEAKTHLSRLPARVADGEEILIATHDPQFDANAIETIR
jgi:antitoxin (DNA-binding transcriptional repressor) of toxin-antitoxin stability system